MIKRLFIIVILTFSMFSITTAQIWYSNISKKEYARYASGQMFYPAKVLYHNDSIVEGFVARINKSDLIRFKKRMEDDNVIVISSREIKAFMYGIKISGYPQYVFKDISKKKKRPKIRPLEIISKGDIMIYTYKWVELPDMPNMPTSNASSSMNMIFYLEKDGKLYLMDNFRKDIRKLISDKKIPYADYTDNYRSKYRDSIKYDEFINLINLYNLIE